MIDKRYSELAIKDDLLSAMIQSMNIYDNPVMIDKAEKYINFLLELINYSEEDKFKFPKWLIPIIEDNLKMYDYLGFVLNEELTEELKSSGDVRNYREYLNNSLKYSKPIETQSGYGLETNEYSGIYLRNCLQDDSCSGILGPYIYDERRNSNQIIMDEEVILETNELRIIGLLEEPINKNIYSVNYDSLFQFTIFEKYIYENLNRKNNLNKKSRIKESLIISSDDDSEVRESDKFLLHSLPNNSKLDMIRNYYDNCKNELINLIVNDDMINESIYNYNDIE